MAITINTQVLGQRADSNLSYCYLYEPLRISVTESNPYAKKLFIDLEPISAETGESSGSLIKYAEFDLNPGLPLSLDLMKIVRQHHNANIYRFGSIDNLVQDGWKSVISEFKYKIHVYSETSSRVVVYKSPIIGGRILQQFTADVPTTQPINEFEYYGLDTAELKTRWGGVSLVDISLKNLSQEDIRPTITKIVNSGKEPCGGWIIWKSRFGGWMFWGFDFETESHSGSYSGDLKVGMFESTADVDGNPFIPVNYTEIKSSYSRTMKALSLNSLELKAVAGINYSPAIYYKPAGSENLELMRLGSAKTPISSQATGGDFSVTLNSISQTSQKTI
jgi:hypothetical protein